MQSGPFHIFSRLLRDYVRDQKRQIAFATACMIITAAATASNAWLMQPVLDRVFLEKNSAMLLIVPLVVIVLAIANGLANYGQTVIMRKVGQRIVADMQMDLFAHLMRSDLKLFHQEASGRLISRFTNDIQMMRLAVSSVLTGVAKECLTMIFLIGVMFYQSWQLAIIAFAVFPIAVYPVIRLGKRMRKVADGTQAQLGNFTAQLDETFQAVRVVKAYNQEEREIARARTTIETLFGLYTKASRVQAAASPIMELLGGVAIAAIIWYGGAQVIAGQTTPGAFFSFIAAMIMAYRPAKTMAGLNNNLQEGLAAAKRLYHVLDTPPAIADLPDATSLTLRGGHIRYDNVSFAYGEGHGGVRGVTLEIPAGAKVALVGPSGSGKSTLMNLLLRFYDVDSGSLTIDGMDIRHATLGSLRSAMALVSQESTLFDDTARANIAYGRPTASEEDILAAARAADADSFIRQMPQGYDTVLGPNGVRLSGGQRQRIAIARAMLKNAPILLLDEATSSLDTTSERSIQASLNTLMQNRTTLIIAHRLSTVMNADIIYVLKDGQVVESGNHAELLARQGEYFALYSHQFETGANVFA